MTYPELWRRLTPRYTDREAQAIIRLLLDERYGLSLTDLYSDKVTQLSPNDVQELEKMMCRLEKGEPVQYVLGTAMFCGRQFHVAPGVLIPRPETEELVQGARERGSVGARERESEGTRIGSTTEVSTDTNLAPSLPRSHAPSSILDIGTGSGCIAITLALENPDAYVEAWDISDEALDIARDNAKRLGANVVFKKVDILDPRPSTLDPRPSTLIISNPPYICEKERATMEGNVLDYEPSTALFVPDDDPLLFYRHIADYAITALCAGGELRFETNPLYVEDVAAMLREKGFTNVTIYPDQFGKQRFVRSERAWERGSEDRFPNECSS